MTITHVERAKRMEKKTRSPLKGSILTGSILFIVLLCIVLSVVEYNSSQRMIYNQYWGKFERGEVSEEETLQAFCGNRSGDRKGTATCFYKPERDADYPGLRYSASEAIKGCWLRCLLPLQLLKKSL